MHKDISFVARIFPAATELGIEKYYAIRKIVIIYYYMLNPRIRCVYVILKKVCFY